VTLAFRIVTPFLKGRSYHFRQDAERFRVNSITTISVVPGGLAVNCPSTVSVLDFVQRSVYFPSTQIVAMEFAG
jgi:hypothetical protein